MFTIAGIPVEVRRKRIKHLHLYVKPPDGHALVTAPLRMSEAEIERFVQTKAGWLQTHVARVQNRPAPAHLTYETGETLPVWGKPYEIYACPGSRNTLALAGDTAVLTVRGENTPARRKKTACDFYRTELAAALERRMPLWEAHTGLHAKSWQTRDMRTRWGTCNVKTGKLWFSIRLAQHPPECLDYVIVHELAHLAERGHNAKFYALLDTFMPEWKAVKAMLNDPH
jgi:predicted metal-dependent hydrolase